MRTPYVIHVYLYTEIDLLEINLPPTFGSGIFTFSGRVFLKYQSQKCSYYFCGKVLLMCFSLWMKLKIFPAEFLVYGITSTL
jgi:hypothetical protein